MFDFIDEDFNDDLAMSVVDQDIDDCEDAEDDLMADGISDSDAIDMVMGDDDDVADMDNPYIPLDPAVEIWGGK